MILSPIISKTDGFLQVHNNKVYETNCNLMTITGENPIYLPEYNDIYLINGQIIYRDGCILFNLNTKKTYTIPGTRYIGDTEEQPPRYLNLYMYRDIPIMLVDKIRIYIGDKPLKLDRKQKLVKDNNIITSFGGAYICVAGYKIYRHRLYFHTGYMDGAVSIICAYDLEKSELTGFIEVWEHCTHTYTIRSDKFYYFNDNTLKVYDLDLNLLKIIDNRVNKDTYQAVTATEHHCIAYAEIDNRHFFEVWDDNSKIVTYEFDKSLILSDSQCRFQGGDEIFTNGNRIICKYKVAECSNSRDTVSYYYRMYILPIYDNLTCTNFYMLSNEKQTIICCAYWCLAKIVGLPKEIIINEILQYI